jgi:cysteinyl-tRNA synthetase
MAKRLGNYFTVKDLTAKGYDPRAIRYLMLSTHYRQQLNFTFEGLEAAKNTLERLTNFARRLLDANGSGGDEDLRLLADRFQSSFEEAMDDDLNINVALVALFDFVRDINNHLDKNMVSSQEAKGIYDLVMKFDEVLGVIGEVREQEKLSKEAEELIRKRQEARQAKDWKEADKLRAQLKSMGVIVEDTAQGAKWRIEKH